MAQAPLFERMLVDSGISLTKFWFSVTQSEQRTRFIIRQVDPVRQWKLSPIDLESLDKWDDYTEAKEAMIRRTDTEWAPWTTVKSNDKKRARINAMRALPVPLRLRRQGRRRRRRARPAHRAARHRRRRRLSPAGATARGFHGTDLRLRGAVKSDRSFQPIRSDPWPTECDAPRGRAMPTRKFPADADRRTAPPSAIQQMRARASLIDGAAYVDGAVVGLSLATCDARQPRVSTPTRGFIGRSPGRGRARLGLLPCHAPRPARAAPSRPRLPGAAAVAVSLALPAFAALVADPVVTSGADAS